MSSTAYNSDSKLNILFISSDKYPPFRPAAKAIYMEELPMRGYRIDWLLQSEGACNSDYTTVNGSGTIYVGATDLGNSRLSRIKKHMLDIINDYKLFKLAKQRQYDVIQVKDKYLSTLMAIVAAKKFGIPLVFWIAFPHAEASIYESKKGIARYKILYWLRGYILKFLLYKIIFPAADHAFVQSEQMKRDIINEGIQGEKLTPIPGSVNLEVIPYKKRPTTSSKVDADSMDQSIVYLGTLNRMRQLDFIIKAFQIVFEQYQEVKLYMIGKGDMEDDEIFLKSIVAELGLKEAVVFTGYMPMKKAWQYIENASVCLSPYFPTPILNSTSPTKLIEYMAMGKAVVGNDHPEQKLVIEQSGAGICTPWEEAAFAQAIITLLKNPIETNTMGLKGRQYVEKYRSNSAMAGVVDTTYKRICGIDNVQIMTDSSRLA